MLLVQIRGIPTPYFHTRHDIGTLKLLQTDDGRTELRAVTGPDYGAFTLSYRIFCMAPDADFVVRLDQIRQDELGWLKAA